jgi:hypothetical protein
VLLSLCSGKDLGCAARHVAIMAAGGARALVLAASRPEAAIVGAAAAAICALCVGATSVSSRNAFTAAGCTAAALCAARRPEADIVEAATSVLLLLAGGADAGKGDFKDIIVAEGGLAVLVAALQRPQANVAKDAAGALLDLTSHGGGDVSFPARRNAVVAAGALAPLLRLVQSQAGAAFNAACVLRNLCTRDHMCGSRHAALMKAGGAAVLAAAAQGPDASLAATAISALWWLACTDGAGKAARLDSLVAAGADQALASVARRPDAGAAADEATRTLWLLADGGDANAGARRNKIVEAGGAELAVAGLAGDPSSRRLAIYACSTLSFRCGGARLERLLDAGCAPALAALLTAGGIFPTHAARGLAQLAAGGNTVHCERIATQACLERLVANLGVDRAKGFYAAAALAELARGGGEALRARIAGAPSCLSRAAAALALAVGGNVNALPAAARVSRAADRLLCALGAARVLAASAADGTLRAALQLALPGTAFERLALRDSTVWGAAGPTGERWRSVWAQAAGDDKESALCLLRALKQLDATIYACFSSRPWLLFPALPKGEPAVVAQRFEDFARPLANV